MATRRNDNGNPVGLAPEAPARAEYERDFYSWLMEQARLVREGRWDALDRENLAEEIEILGAGAIQQAGKRAARAAHPHLEVGSPAGTT